MRFNTPLEIVAWADNAAIDTMKRHLEHGHDLNVFSTEGARNDWQRGFDNAPPRSFEVTQDYDTAYQRGKAIRKLMDSKI
jgi:hypothetical protein